jgi:ketosteroid isomerase-like protein
MRFGLPRLICFVVIASTLLSACVTHAQEPVIPSWAASFLREWYIAYNQGDAARVASFFAPDAQMGALRGREHIQASLASDFAATSYRCGGDFENFKEVEGMAVAWGVDTCTETHGQNGVATPTRERWLLVFQRETDGAWLISRETWVSLPR